MRGSVLGFDPDTNAGAITGDDGIRYDFVRLEWHGSERPVHGTAVDFVADGSRATRIYPASASFDPVAGDTAKIIYILYLVGLAVLITPIVGVIIAYVNRSAAPEWVGTHYQVQIRTFWIGILYWLISIVTMFIFIGFLFAVFALIWWIVRCAKGLQRVSRGEPYENPTTWLW